MKMNPLTGHFVQIEGKRKEVKQPYSKTTIRPPKVPLKIPQRVPTQSTSLLKPKRFYGPGSSQSLRLSPHEMATMLEEHVNGGKKVRVNSENRVVEELPSTEVQV